MRIQPFHAVRPPRHLAARVASLPYDVVDTAQARSLAAGNDASFLRVIRPEIDLPAGVDPYDDRVYEKARQNLAHFRERGYLVADEGPAMFVYRLRTGKHVQSGLVTTCHIEEYEQDVIKKHERTIRTKEDDRARLVDALNADAGPVFLMYRDDPGIAAMMEAAQCREPVVDFTADDGVQHTAWRVKESAPWVDRFSTVPAAYVADGHHRAASAVRVGRMRGKANPHHRGDEPYNWFLSVLFPAGQLQVLAYNRTVADLGALTTDRFLACVRESFTVSPNAPPVPDREGRIAMYLAGGWHGLDRDRDRDDPDPVNRLDVSVLQQRLLGPILGIRDPRTDLRVACVGGALGTGELKRQVDEGEAAVAFSMYPTSLDQLMSIADAGSVMPPKSTWFEPKLRSGLFLHYLVN